MTVDATIITTPVGPLSLLTQHDTVVSAGFAQPETMAARLPGQPEVVVRRELGRLSRAVESYFAGDVRAIDDIPVSQPGAAFQQAAWKVMREIAPGAPISYAALAERAGNPKATRASGTACARNLVALIVPCHRVVRSGGMTGNYYYGSTVKVWLLDHERRAIGLPEDRLPG